jgi:hypothetical protein
MDKVTLRLHLELAEKHYRQGLLTLARQRQILSELERDGQDTLLAETILKQVEQSQATHMLYREQLQAELKALESEP